MSSPPLHHSLLLASPLAMQPDMAHEQKQSPLFGKLPRELRNRIFDLALILDPISLTSEDLMLPFSGPRNHFQTPFALLQTCRQIYLETYLTPLHLSTLTYKIHGLDYFQNIVTPTNDKLLWIYQWQRQLLQKVHVHAMLCGHTTIPGAYNDAVTETIDSLSPRLGALKVLHISVWGDPAELMEYFPPKKWLVAMSIFRLADLPNQYPLLKEVIVEFGTPTEHTAILDEMVKELASGNYDVADGQQLRVDSQSVQDLDWIMSLGGAPEGMISRVVRWKKISKV